MTKLFAICTAQKRLFGLQWRRQVCFAAIADVLAKAVCAIFAYIVVIYFDKTVQSARTPPTIIGSIVLAPVMESFALAAFIEALSVMGVVSRFSIPITALLAGWLHGMDRGWLAFVAVSFSFFVYSALYSIYRKESFLSGVVSSAVPHAISNAVFVIIWMVMSMSYSQ